MISQQSHPHEPVNDEVFEQVKFSDLVTQTLVSKDLLVVESDQESSANSSDDEERREPPHTSPQPQPSTNSSPIWPSISSSYNCSTIRLSPGSPTDTFVVVGEPRGVPPPNDKILQKLDEIKTELSNEIHVAESQININVQHLASTVVAQGKLLTTILE